jgi:hypothetical protein
MKAQPRETRVPKGGGIVAACLVSLAMAFFTGLGGALISMVVGIVTCVIVSSILSNGLSYEREDMLGSAQLEGVLDSSQLDGPNQYDEAQLPNRLRQCGRIVVAASFVAALASSGLVLAATGGSGFRVWLGGFSLFPTTTQQEQKKPTNTKETTNNTRQNTDESDDVYYEEWTHYPEEDYEEDYWDYEEPQQNTPESTPTENTPTPTPPADSGAGTDTGAGATTDTSATVQDNAQTDASASGQTR